MSSTRQIGRALAPAINTYFQIIPSFFSRTIFSDYFFESTEEDYQVCYKNTVMMNFLEIDHPVTPEDFCNLAFFINDTEFQNYNFIAPENLTGTSLTQWLKDKHEWFKNNLLIDAASAGNIDALANFKKVYFRPPGETAIMIWLPVDFQSTANADVINELADNIEQDFASSPPQDGCNYRLENKTEKERLICLLRAEASRLIKTEKDLIATEKDLITRYAMVTPSSASLQTIDRTTTPNSYSELEERVSTTTPCSSSSASSQKRDDRPPSSSPYATTSEDYSSSDSPRTPSYKR